MQYAYSPNVKSNITADTLRSSLADNSIEFDSNMIPSYIFSVSGGFGVSTDHTSEMNDEWRDSLYVAKKYYWGVLNEYSTTSDNLYDINPKFRDYTDNNHIEHTSNLYSFTNQNLLGNGLMSTVKSETSYCSIISNSSIFRGYIIDKQEEVTNVYYTKTEVKTNPATLNKVDAKPATCTVDGNIEYWTLDNSRFFSDSEGRDEILEEDTVIKAGHDYKETIVPPTCTTKGYTIHKCTRCSDEYNDTETEMTAHSFGDWTVTTKPTCTAKGVETRKCKNCEATETRDVDALGHKWSDWKTTAFDTDKNTLTQTRTCSVCNKTETKTTENAIQRLAGSGRYETTAEISQAAFDQAETVVLAYGLNYADALAGVSLATKMNAPILLTNTKTLDATTLAEIKRLKAKNVIILGGEGAISAAVENSLKKEGLTTDRIFGASRFGTATAIGERLNEKPTDVFFVYAFNSADALSVSPIAASKNAPIIYLSTKGDLHPDTAAYLAKLKKAGSVKNAYVIGGEGVISNDMMNKAGNALGVTPTRVFGKDRFATCVAVNEQFKDTLNGDMLCVATGMDFPDALAGGVYAAINKAPLFLVNGKLKTPKLTDEQKAYLKTKAAGKITAFGGTGVVPDSHIADIAQNSI